MSENHFDAVILGTGLVESILAAALSKAGYKVAHVDSNEYYGGDEASMAADELSKWADNLTGTTPSCSRFASGSQSGNVPPQYRTYAICLRPAIIPSIGPMISALVSSGVSKYSGFRLLESVAFYDGPGRVRGVPGSKEDIFQNKEISLIEKRRLMRFLTFASGEFEGKPELEGKHDTPFLEFIQSTFSLNKQIASVIAYALAFCLTGSEPTLSTLTRLRHYMRSSGRYGSSPFLVGHYGGIGDIAQGFCRASAVSGGVYILGRRIASLSYHNQRGTEEETTSGSTSNKTPPFSLTLDDFPEPITCNLAISSPAYRFATVPTEVERPVRSPTRTTSTDIARCTVIIDKPLSFKPAPSEPSEPHPETTEAPDSATAHTSREGVDTSILVFAPGSVEGGSSASVTAFVNGEGSLSTPRNRWVVYLSRPILNDEESQQSPQALLQPYLDSVLSLSLDPSVSPIQPLFTTFYTEKRLSAQESSLEDTSGSSSSRYLILPPLQASALPDLPDEAALIAEDAFKEATSILRSISPSSDDDSKEPIPFWPPLPQEEEDEEW